MKNRKFLMDVLLVIVVLLFFEIASRTFFYWRVNYSYPHTYSATDWRLLWASEKAKEFSTRITDDYHPVLGWVPKAGLEHLDLPGWDMYDVNTNSKGLRGRQEYTYKRNKKKRIIVFGDSFTWGQEVGDTETYAYYLQQLLPGTEVLNMGVHGYGHDQMLLYLQREGLKYSPDLIIIGFWAGDSERNIQSFRDYAKPRFRLKNGSLVLRTDHILPPERMRALVALRPRSFDLISFCLEMMNGPNLRKEAVPLTEAILDEMREAARKAHVPIVFVRLPCMQALNDLTTHDMSLDQYAVGRKVNIISLEKYFARAFRKDVPFNTRSHWKAREHYIAAQGIRAELLKQKLLQRTP